MLFFKFLLKNELFKIIQSYENIINVITSKKNIMGILLAIPRFLLAFIYVVLGLNFFFNFIPLPDMQGDAKVFMGILINSNIMLIVKIIEIVGGLMLFLGIFSKLALILLMPISVNILLFHTLIAQDNPILSIILVSFNFISLFAYTEDLKSIFKGGARV